MYHKVIYFFWFGSFVAAESEWKRKFIFPMLDLSSKKFVSTCCNDNLCLNLSLILCFVLGGVDYNPYRLTFNLKGYCC